MQSYYQKSSNQTIIDGNVINYDENMIKYDGNKLHYYSNKNGDVVEDVLSNEDMMKFMNNSMRGKVKGNTLESKLKKLSKKKRKTKKRKTNKRKIKKRRKKKKKKTKKRRYKK